MDTFFLLQGADRELLVPEHDRRKQLWPSRVWPGAILTDGDIVGVWRRAQHLLNAQPWTRLSATQRHAVEAEAAALQLPGVNRDIVIHWASKPGGRLLNQFARLANHAPNNHPGPRSHRAHNVAIHSPLKRHLKP